MAAKVSCMSTTAIINARIYTCDTGFRCISNGTIVFDQHGIQALGDTSTTPVPADANVIDGKGRLAVLPGLIDVHSHSSLLKGYTENAQLMDWLPQYQREHRVLTEADAYHGFLVSYMEALKGGTTRKIPCRRYHGRSRFRWRHLQQHSQHVGMHESSVVAAQSNPARCRCAGCAHRAAHGHH